MLKANMNPHRFQILFWDVIFWLMKILQRLRGQWISFVVFIRSAAPFRLLLLLCVSALGLGLGYLIGYFKAYFLGW